MVFLAVSYFLMIGEIWDQSAEVGTGPCCNHKDDAAAIVDPNAVNTYIPSITPQPTV
jgi:hypothetical protein